MQQVNGLVVLGAGSLGNTAAVPCGPRPIDEAATAHSGVSQLPARASSLWVAQRRAPVTLMSPRHPASLRCQERAEAIAKTATAKHMAIRA